VIGTACVIAQQSSSATIVSLRFHSLEENSAPFKNAIFTSLKTFMILKKGNLTLSNSGSVCIGLMVPLPSAHAPDMKTSARSSQVHVPVTLIPGKKHHVSNG
jgi:hypothetical protein